MLEDPAAPAAIVASTADDASAVDDASEPSTRPKPWWQDHPEIKAMVARTEQEIFGGPYDTIVHATDAADQSDSTEATDAFDQSDPASITASAVDDASQAPTPPKPWWQDHPEITAIVARTEREILDRPERPDVDHEDPVSSDVFSGDSIRELRDARDDLARARVRYDAAVCRARAVGLSWGQIGGLLGVTRQQLHRRYRRIAD